MLWESDEIELGSCSVPTSESVLSTALLWGWGEQETLSLSLRLLKGFGFGLKRGIEGEGGWRRRREESGGRRRGFEETTNRRSIERLKKEEDENERKGNGEERKCGGSRYRLSKCAALWILGIGMVFFLYNKFFFIFF